MSELHALSGQKFIVFNAVSVIVFPNLNHLCQNENPGFRRDPIVFLRLLNGKGGTHSSYPVKFSDLYLKGTTNFNSLHLFVRPSMANISFNKIRWYL